MTATDILRTIAALGLVITLIGLCAWFAQKLSRGRFAPKIKGHPERLQLIEWKALDPRHQLFLIRRDDTEHLILLSTQGSPLLIEPNIKKTDVANSDHTSTKTATTAMPLSLGAADPLYKGVRP